jgi:CRISPR system Cascade subunit CasA
MTNFNLIEEEWIEVLCDDGSQRKIRPSQILDRSIKPERVSSGEAEYDSGYIQFLIGLVQTCFPPEDDIDWEEKYRNPPSQDELEKAFSEYKDAFNLFGDHPRYMQSDLDVDSVNGIHFLFHDNFGGGLIGDLQVFRKNEDNLHQNCGRIAALLTSFQAEGSGLSGGFYPSIRQGGPLTYIIQGDNLWETVWLNVIPTDDLNRDMACDSYNGVKFPWMSSKDVTSLNQNDFHPCAVYWLYGKKIELVRDDEEGVKFKRGKYNSKPYPKGGAGWKHPLSPYTEENGDNIPLAKRASMDQNAGDLTCFRLAEEGRKPKNLEQLDFNRKYGDVWAPNLRVFGPDYKGNKDNIEGYIDRKIPILSDDQKESEELRLYVNSLVNLIDSFESYLAEALYRCSSDDDYYKSDFRSRVSLFQEVEDDFYRLLRELKEGYVSQGDIPPDEVSEGFIDGVREVTLSLFDLYMDRDLNEKFKSADDEIRVPILEKEELKEELESVIQGFSLLA